MQPAKVMLLQCPKEHLSCHLRHYYKPIICIAPDISGNINIPVLSLHTIGDLFVPFLMEQIYAERVAAQGKSDLLVQRAIRDVGHCAFTTAERESAFEDLVNWVVNGMKPAGDDILDPEVVADPNFGCNFTPVDHQYIPPCQ